jgi:hypothetical protein
MVPSIATKFQYINSLLFSFSLTTCFGPYGPSSGECISNIDNTLATKKRQAITGVRQKASTAHSSITTTLMD